MKPVLQNDTRVNKCGKSLSERMLSPMIQPISSGWGISGDFFVKPSLKILFVYLEMRGRAGENAQVWDGLGKREKPISPLSREPDLGLYQDPGIMT